MQDSSGCISGPTCNFLPTCSVSQSQRSLACPQALAFLRLPVGFGQWELWRESEAGRTGMLESPAPLSCLAVTPSPCLSREPPPASHALGPGLASKPHCPSFSVPFFVVSLHSEHSFINSLFIMLSSSYPSLNVPSVLCQDPDWYGVLGICELVIWSYWGLAGQQCHTGRIWSGNPSSLWSHPLTMLMTSYSFFLKSPLSRHPWLPALCPFLHPQIPLLHSLSPLSQPLTFSQLTML